MWEKENSLIRVLLVAPSPALRAGFRSLLSSDDEIKIVDERNEWSDSLQDKQCEVDVVVTTSTSHLAYSDYSAETVQPAAILFLRDEPLSNRFLIPASRAWGILPLDASADELCASIHALAHGLIVGTHQLLFSASEEQTMARGPLTDREAEVLALLAKGLANKQIAVLLGISEHTVKFHVSSIYAKLNATNRTQAVREGLRNGWIVL